MGDVINKRDLFRDKQTEQRLKQLKINVIKTVAALAMSGVAIGIVVPKAVEALKTPSDTSNLLNTLRDSGLEHRGLVVTFKKGTVLRSSPTIREITEQHDDNIVGTIEDRAVTITNPVIVLGLDNKEYVITNKTQASTQVFTNPIALPDFAQESVAILLRSGQMSYDPTQGEPINLPLANDLVPAGSDIATRIL